MNLALIPARGGSKRIPGKNIRDFAGKPIIAYSIEAALNSGKFDRVIVSTDSERIAEVARAAGAEVPFMRPPELSDDHTPTIPVVRHAIDWMTGEGDSPSHACCIYATAPFLEPEDLRRGWDMLEGNAEARFAISVTSFAFPIQRALKCPAEGEPVAMFWPEHELTRSQDLPEAVHDAGQFYWGTVEAYRTKDGFFSGPTLAVPIPRYRVQDIDTPEDWERAERMYMAAGKTDEAATGKQRRKNHE